MNFLPSDFTVTVQTVYKVMRLYLNGMQYDAAELSIG